MESQVQLGSAKWKARASIWTIKTLQPILEEMGVGGDSTFQPDASLSSQPCIPCVDTMTESNTQTLLLCQL